MNKIKALCFAIGLAIGVTAYAGIPADCDCAGWLRLLERCEASSSGMMYGMTCSEIYYHWQDCLSDPNC